ncbi:DUF6223 family protein [Actinoplanes sp. NPDC051513]|uniref:DUF6223 family protein n=1 Tax=Actinoplanes sp. NPDC051513 TaxID=3363908 RepID=UPI0037A0F3D9
MSVHHLIAASTVDAHALTGDRIVATSAVLVTLAGAVLGGLALARGNRRAATAALVAGVIGMVTGGIVVVTADGGPGTGNGVVGGYVALVIGLVAAVLGGLAGARRRKSLRRDVEAALTLPEH